MVLYLEAVGFANRFHLCHLGPEFLPSRPRASLFQQGLRTDVDALAVRTGAGLSERGHWSSRQSFCGLGAGEGGRAWKGMLSFSGLCDVRSPGRERSGCVCRVQVSIH